MHELLKEAERCLAKGPDVVRPAGWLRLGGMEYHLEERVTMGRSLCSSLLYMNMTCYVIVGESRVHFNNLRLPLHFAIV